MPLTVRSEIRHWENASRVEECTQDYISVPKALFSGDSDWPPGSVVQGKVVGISYEMKGDPDGDEYSSTIRDKKLRTRLVKGNDMFDYLFIFEKDWKPISKYYSNSSRKYMMYLIEEGVKGRKRERVYSGNSVYWEESYGNDLEL